MSTNMKQPMQPREQKKLMYIPIPTKEIQDKVQTVELLY